MLVALLAARGLSYFCSHSVEIAYAYPQYFSYRVTDGDILSASMRRSLSWPSPSSTPIS
jgi:hypothetical protein